MHIEVSKFGCHKDRRSGAGITKYEVQYIQGRQHASLSHGVTDPVTPKDKTGRPRHDMKGIGSGYARVRALTWTSPFPNVDDVTDPHACWLASGLLNVSHVPGPWC